MILVVQGRELIRLVLIDQRLHHLVEAAFEDFIELVQRQIDAVIGHATLWKVVGTNAFLAIARTHQELALLRLFRGLFGLLGVE